MAAKGIDPDLAKVADLVHGAAVRLLRCVRREDAAAGLSAPQLSALSVLVFGGPQTMSKLAMAEQVRAPTMSRLVDDLERLGLAERTAQAGDRRVNIVRVTDAGRALLQEGRGKRLARLSEMLSGASHRELDALRRGARTIVRLTDSAVANRSKIGEIGAMTARPTTASPGTTLKQRRRNDPRRNRT